MTSSQPFAVEAILSIPSAQFGTLSPRIVTRSVSLGMIGTAGLYTIYSAISVVDGEAVYRSSVDIVVHYHDGGTIVDEFRKLSLLITDPELA